MTPKEKALQLVQRYINEACQDNEVVLYTLTAKKCALIAVDEIIEQWERVNTYYSDFGGELNPNLIFWYEVKKEIEAL